MGTSCDIFESGISCGVDAVQSMSDNVDSMLRDIAGHYLYESHHKGHDKTSGFTSLIWSDVVRRKSGGAARSPGLLLALRLSRLFPDSIIASPARTNSNTGNKIKTWIFTPSTRSIRKWIKEKYPDLHEEWVQYRKEERTDGRYY